MRESEGPRGESARSTGKNVEVPVITDVNKFVSGYGSSGMSNDNPEKQNGYISNNFILLLDSDFNLGVAIPLIVWFFIIVALYLLFGSARAIILGCTVAWTVMCAFAALDVIFSNEIKSFLSNNYHVDISFGNKFSFYYIDLSSQSDEKLARLVKLVGVYKVLILVNVCCALWGGFSLFLFFW